MARGCPLTRAEIEPVLAPLEQARSLPARAYLDEDVFAFESDVIFGQAWLCVGRSDELALPGQWLRTHVAREPVLVVRGADLRLRAFFDVCPHRGASLVGRREGGRLAHFECPYHGHTYELDGRCASAPHLAGALPRLSPARVDEWRGFVFVCLDAATPALTDWLGEVPPWFSEDVTMTLSRVRRRVYTVEANWKLLGENFQESHHFPRVHRALEQLTPTARAETWRGAGPWLGGIMPIEGRETVSLDGARHGRPLLAHAVKDPVHATRVFDALLFPGLLTSLQPDYLLTYRLEPLGPGATRVTTDVYIHPAGAGKARNAEDVFEFWDRVNAEDKAICEDQQANAVSRAFAAGRYASVEDGVHAFDTLVARAHMGASGG